MFTNKYKKQTDEALMEGIALGSTKAFDELYGRYSQKTLHYFYRMLGKDEEKAQDFMQDLFLKIIEKPHLFKKEYRFATWLFTIANNMCKNEYRRLKIRTDKDHFVGDFNIRAGDVIFPNIDKQLDNQTFCQLLMAEVAEMNETKRNTFLLRYQEHFSIKEISEIMGCSEGTVKSRLFYTTKKLAEKLKVFNPSGSF